VLILYLRHRRNGSQLHKKTRKEDKQFIKKHSSEPPIREKYNYQPIFLKTKTEIAFNPDNSQVIYIESKYNEPLNKFILKEYEMIAEFFAKSKYNFIYIPQLINDIALNGVEMVKYKNPQLNDSDISTQDGDFVHQLEGSLLSIISEQMIVNDPQTKSYIKKPMHLNGGLLRYKKTENSHYIFSYYQFEKFEDDEIWEQFLTYIRTIGYEYDRPLYSLSKSVKYKKEVCDCICESKIFKEDYNARVEEADFTFSYDAEKLIYEIEERIKLLKQSGITEMVLKSLFKFDNSPKLSKLFITKDYRIFLPDYNNMEINMSPLPKAVYFLFLKHPDGIMFKHLTDYRNELNDIYLHISNRENLFKMQKSIVDITDPTQNAINEKCSRIREAFISKFDESLAQNYFVTGLRAEPKKITLNRELVVWE